MFLSTPNLSAASLLLCLQQRTYGIRTGDGIKWKVSDVSGSISLKKKKDPAIHSKFEDVSWTLCVVVLNDNYIYYSVYEGRDQFEKR